LELVGRIIEDWVQRPAFPMASPAVCSLLERLSPWFQEDEAFARARDAFGRWAGLQPGTEVPESLFFSMLFDPGVPGKTRNELERPGVKLVPMMRARGLTCRALVLLGLSSGDFPRRIEEDYFLGDPTRAEVVKRSGILGHRMPVKSRYVDEMALLFYLLNTSAQRVHWVVPETDSTGRLVTPTSWIQDYLQHWSWEESPFLRRIAPAPTEQAWFLRDLDPEGGSHIPPGLVFLLGSSQQRRVFDPDAASLPWRPLRSVSARGAEFYGKVSAAAFPSAGDSLRVTSVEKLARCPFKYYAEDLLGAVPLEKQVYPEGISSLERGSVLHSVLEGLFVGSRSIEAAMRAGKDHPEVIRSAVARELTRRSAGVLLPPLFLSLLADELAGRILGYLDFAAENTPPERVFLSFEQSLEQPFPGLPEVRLKGKADRIDRDEPGGALHVIDYKSGQNRELGVQKNRPSVYALGWMAQASLYPWMLAESGEKGRIDFSYVFLGEADRMEIPAEAQGAAVSFLGSLEGILSSGSYLPSDNGLMETARLPFLEPCRNCRCAPLCRRIDPVQRPVMADLFRRHCGSRAELISEVGGSLPNEPDRGEEGSL